MHYLSIEFLQEDINDTSRIFFVFGTNNWFKRQVREKLEETYGKTTFVDAAEDGALREVAGELALVPIIGRKERLRWIRGAEADQLVPFAKYIDLVPKGVCLVLEPEIKKIDKRWIDSLKNKIADITADTVDFADPPDDLARFIIRKLAHEHQITNEPIIEHLFQSYGPDLEQCEENLKKLALTGNLDRSVLDKKEVGVPDIWRLADLWIENKLASTLYLLEQLSKANGLQAYTIHLHLCRQFRQHALAKNGNKTHYAVKQRADKASSSWLTKTYKELCTLDPVLKNYYDQLYLIVCSSTGES